MKIVTDSAADMSNEEMEKLGIIQAPLFIQFPEGEVNSADISADEFYNRFNLDGHSFSEYYFKDMQRIFHLEGMDHWPTTLNGSKMQIQLSLVCFSPIAAPTDNSREAYLVSTAKEKVVKMFLSCFHLQVDHECIQLAMDNYPTLSIFMSIIDRDKRSCSGKNKQKRAYLMTKKLVVLLLLIISVTALIRRCCGLQQHEHNLPWKAYMWYGGNLDWLRTYCACF